MSAGRSARGPSTGWRPPFYCKATWRAVNTPRGRSRTAIGRQSKALMKLRSILIVLLIVVAALGIAAYQVIKWAQEPAIPARLRPPSKVVIIPDRSSFQQVAALLEREEIIRSRLAFVWLARYQSADRKVQAGEYDLNPGMTPAEILSRLTGGQVVLHPILIPEGLTMVQIADIFGQQGLMDRQEALQWMKDPAFIASLGIRADTLEGYLYPDTYKFPK